MSAQEPQAQTYKNNKLMLEGAITSQYGIFLLE